MTPLSANGIELTERLLYSGNNQSKSLGREPRSIIQQNFTTKWVPVEITNETRILSSSLSNLTLCKDFLSKAMMKSQAHARTTLTKLDNKQSVLQLFKFCNHPNISKTRDNDLCSDVDPVISCIFGTLINRCTPSEHAIMIDAMITKQKGAQRESEILGLQSAQYTFTLRNETSNMPHETFGPVTTPFTLPCQHTSTPCTKTRNQSRTHFKTFQKYYTDFRDTLCVSEIVPDRDAFFVRILSQHMQGRDPYHGRVLPMYL